MKSINKILFVILCILAINLSVKADCNDSNLNTWANGIKAKYVYNTSNNSENPYAYFIGISDYREDIKIEVTDGSGAKAEGRLFEKMDNLYAVGCYTNFEEETYTINVYGNEKSRCNNELLRTIKYTVPKLNSARKDAFCEKYKDHELCQPFTNKTSEMTEEEVHKELEKYDKEVSSDLNKKDSLLITILKYSLYVIIPLAIMTVVYLLSVGKFKKGEKR